jgi:hypothetical protein
VETGWSGQQVDQPCVVVTPAIRPKTTNGADPPAGCFELEQWPNDIVAVIEITPLILKVRDHQFH